VGINVTFYAKGEAVGMNRLNADDYGRGTGYLGKDVMGSVRGITDIYGVLEGRYEYDVFGAPYEGEMNRGMNLGYTGKPYDSVTGLYDYGYRDYAPETARFTTEDPIRDGANWFAYVNNDPINFDDLLGLAPRNMPEKDRDTYKTTVSEYAQYVFESNKMGIPDGYDCADVATYLYGQGMAATGNTAAATQLQHNGENITSIPQIQSSDFFPENTNNITFYENKSFNSPDVEVGTVAVWAGPGGSGGTGWVGHVATVVDVQRDNNGNVISIVTLEGHSSRNTAIDTNEREDWKSYEGTFLGFGEIGRNSTTSSSTQNQTLNENNVGLKGK
jgi:RHS repeat-associated protein